MALDSGYWEETNNMNMDDVAALLVELYGEYRLSVGGYDNNKTEVYAKAVGIAVRMLSD